MLPWGLSGAERIPETTPMTLMHIRFISLADKRLNSQWPIQSVIADATEAWPGPRAGLPGQSRGGCEGCESFPGLLSGE